MSGVTREGGTFREIARLKLADERVGAALDLSTSRLMNGRVLAWDALDGAQELRERAHEARMRVIDDLDTHLAQFRETVEARGGKTFLAGSAADANAYIVDVCRNAGAKLAAKSKSMATEEIGLNEALEAAGVRAGGDRPGRVHPPARRRAPGSHPRARDREDEGGRRRAAVASGRPACGSRARGADEGRTPPAAGDVPRRRRGHHRRELRSLRNGLDRSRHERGQRAARLQPAPSPRRADGHGAARRLALRSRPCCCGCSRAAARGSGCPRIRR